MDDETTPFTLGIPSMHVARIAAAFCGLGNYQRVLPDGTPNPVTPVMFTQQQVAEWITEQVAQWESLQAMNQTYELVKRNVVIPVTE